MVLGSSIISLQLQEGTTPLSIASDRGRHMYEAYSDLSHTGKWGQHEENADIHSLRVSDIGMAVTMSHGGGALVSAKRYSGDWYVPTFLDNRYHEGTKLGPYRPSQSQALRCRRLKHSGIRALDA